MKIVYNVEMSHVKEVVISHKVFYVKNSDNVFIRDDERTFEETIKKDIMPKELTSEEMAEYIRDYVGRKKWKIVFSTGTINIFKKGTKQKSQKTDESKKKTGESKKKSKR